MIICLPPTPSPLSLAISEELRNATAACDAGDIESALAHLRSAYALATTAGFGLGPDACLRLPMYLQRAGRPLEAWTELQALLSPDHPVLSYGVSGQPLWLAGTHLHIYDKMRVFLQREKMPALATCYSVLSYVCMGDCLHESIADLDAHDISTCSTRDRLRQFCTAESIEQALARDLKRGSLLAAMPQVVSWVQESLKTRLLPNPPVLLDQIRTVLGVTEVYP